MLPDFDSFLTDHTFPFSLKNWMKSQGYPPPASIKLKADNEICTNEAKEFVLEGFRLELTILIHYTRMGQVIEAIELCRTILLDSNFPLKFRAGALETAAQMSNHLSRPSL
jgi:hypothetical protein